MGRNFWVYITASGRCGYLYTGMTNDLVRRIDKHRSRLFDGYTVEHRVDRLVWFEHHRYVDQAILREKPIKRWKREWKFALVEEKNPHWLDLYETLDRTRRPDQP